jgi:hypothetical protein
MTDKKPPHRPKGSTIPIDWGQVDKMCAIQCTGEEIAGVLDIDYDTLSSACKRENGLLWLGKNWLGQTDKMDTTSSDGSMTPPTTINLVAKEFENL